MIGSINLYSYIQQNKLIKKIQLQQKSHIIKQVNNIERERIDTAINSINQVSNALKFSLANALYNIDDNTIKNNILEFLLDNDTIVSVLLFDNIMNNVNVISLFIRDNLKSKKNKK